MPNMVMERPQPIRHTLLNLYNPATTAGRSRGIKPPHLSAQGAHIIGSKCRTLSSMALIWVPPESGLMKMVFWGLHVFWISFSDPRGVTFI